MKNNERYNQLLRNWEVPGRLTSQEAWEQVAPRLRTAAVERSMPLRERWFAVAAAASLALIIGLSLWQPHATQQVVAQTTTTITLPDQSAMTLNAGSQATFAKEWNNERWVELRGQAFFEVKKGEKFTVKTPNGTVEVRGTSFDVLARDNQWLVRCYTGSVSVKTATDSSLLHPGMATSLQNGRLITQDFDVHQPDWRQGVFAFQNAPLQAVLEELERQFQITVAVEGIHHRYYTGQFSNRNLTEALEAICVPMHLTFIQNGDTVSIQSR